MICAIVSLTYAIHTYGMATTNIAPQNWRDR